MCTFQILSNSLNEIKEVNISYTGASLILDMYRDETYVRVIETEDMVHIVVKHYNTVKVDTVLDKGELSSYVITRVANNTIKDYIPARVDAFRSRQIVVALTKRIPYEVSSIYIKMKAKYLQLYTIQRS